MTDIPSASTVTTTRLPPGWLPLRIGTGLLIAATAMTAWFTWDMCGLYLLMAEMAAPERMEYVSRTPWLLRAAVALAAGSVLCAVVAMVRARGKYRAVAIIEIIAAGTFVLLYLIARTEWSPASLLLPLVGVEVPAGG